MRATVVAVCTLCLLAACSSPKEMEKDSTSMKTDSAAVERWPQSDAKATVDSMAGDLLQGQWLQRWKKGHESNPTLIIGPIENKTMTSVDERLLDKDIKESIMEKRSLTDDSIQVIWDTDFLCQTLQEQTSQCGHWTGPPISELARKKGADFLLIGTIKSRMNEKQYESDGRPDVDLPTKYFSYPVKLELVNLEKNKEAWLQERVIGTIVHWLASSPRSSEDSESCDSTVRRSRC